MGPTQYERSRLLEYPFMTYRLYLYLRESFIARSTFDRRQDKIFEERKRGTQLELCKQVSYVEYNLLRSAWENPHTKENRGVIFRLGHLGSHSTHTNTPEWFNVWYVRYFSDPGVFKIKRQRSGLYRTEEAAVHAAMGVRHPKPRWPLLKESMAPKDLSVIEVETKEDVLGYLLLASTT